MKKLLVLAVVGVLAGCAGGDDSAAGEKSGTEPDSSALPQMPVQFSSPDTSSPPPVPPSHAVWVRVKDDTLAISNSYLATGDVKIAILNEDDEVHTIEINSGRARWRTIPIQPGNEAILTVQLDPTDHNVFCVEPKHREKGEVLKFEAVAARE